MWFQIVFKHNLPSMKSAVRLADDLLLIPMDVRCSTVNSWVVLEDACILNNGMLQNHALRLTATSDNTTTSIIAIKLICYC